MPSPRPLVSTAIPRPNTPNSQPEDPAETKKHRQAQREADEERRDAQGAPTPQPPRNLRLLPTILYRKPLRCITNGLQPINKRIVRLNRSLDRNVVRLFEADRLQ